MPQKLFKSTAITGGMTLISRVAGLIRDIVFANFMGATVAADAFYIAFRIPNFFRRIFAEGAFSQAFVPVFMEYRDQRGHEATREFAGHMAGAFAAILFGVTLIGVVAAPLLIMGLAPGFIDHPEKFDLTVAMLRITFPYLLFISLVSMAAGMLNSFGRFAAAAFTPVLLNLVLIGAVLWLAPRLAQPVMALAWGVLIAGVAQLLFQIPFLLRIGMLPRVRLKKDAGVVRVFRLMGPAIFGSSVSQINMLVNTFLASFLITGSVSWLYYSDRLMEFPLGIFGIALATVLLPSLSAQHAANSPQAFSRMLDWALRWAVVVAVPSALGLIMLAEPIMTTLFYYGEFQINDVVKSGQALVAFSLGLVAIILVKVLAPGFFARHDTATPAKIAAIAFGTNIVLSLALVFPLKHVGLALAISLAAILNAALLYRRLRKLDVYQPERGWRWLNMRVAIATTTMAAVLYYVRGDLDGWLAMTASTRVFWLACWIGAGVLVYVLIMALLGTRLAELKMKPINE
ncbi:MAG: murein biosynthesis integral membrane protein MurJ [Acidiferrobacterales bacterium]